MADGVDVSTIAQSQFFSSLFLQQREKLPTVNTIDQCVDLIHSSRNIIVLTGAGCSVSCGIPDFRSRDGVYARLRVDFPDLPDPQAMFDIYYFQHDPRPFFKFAKEIYPGQFKPSLSHRFVKKLEENGKLLRNYTQNIDTLEMAAQIENVIQCHGSFATATCTVCKYRVDAEFIREQIFNQEIPYCDKCKANQESKATVDSSDKGPNEKSEYVNNTNGMEEDHGHGHDDDDDDDKVDKDFMPKFNSSSSSGDLGVGILKPDIVFFGEGLPDLYHRSIDSDKTKCDLLIVIGSSLKVKPVANIPHLLKPDVPQILINRESLKHLNFDVELLGDCDVIVNELLLRLEQKRKENSTNTATEVVVEEEEEEENAKASQWDSICADKQRLTMLENDESEKMFFGKGEKNSNSNSKQKQQLPEAGAEQSDEEEDEDDKDKDEEEEEEEDLPSTSTKTTWSSHQQQNKDSERNGGLAVDYMNENSFLHLKPNMYVFHGAELNIRAVKKRLRMLRKKLGLFELDMFESDGSNDSNYANRGRGLGAIYSKEVVNGEDDSDDSDEFDSDSESDSSSGDSNELTTSGDSANEDRHVLEETQPERVLPETETTNEEENL